MSTYRSARRRPPPRSAMPVGSPNRRPAGRRRAWRGHGRADARRPWAAPDEPAWAERSRPGTLRKDAGAKRAQERIEGVRTEVTAMVLGLAVGERDARHLEEVQEAVLIKAERGVAGNSNTFLPRRRDWYETSTGSVSKPEVGVHRRGTPTATRSRGDPGQNPTSPRQDDCAPPDGSVLVCAPPGMPNPTTDGMAARRARRCHPVGSGSLPVRSGCMPGRGGRKPWLRAISGS